MQDTVEGGGGKSYSERRREQSWGGDGQEREKMKGSRGGRGDSSVEMIQSSLIRF